MVARLNSGVVRGALLAAVAALVFLLHAVTIGAVADGVSAWQRPPAPERMRATYVRTLEIAPPAAPATPAAATFTAAPAKARVVIAAAASAASQAPAPVLVAASDSAAASDVGKADFERAAAIDAPASAAAVATAADAAADAVVAAASAASASDGFAWPVSTRVSYLLSGNYRGPIDGRAEVEWIRVGERYQVEVSISAGPEFAPIFSRRMMSTGRIEAIGLVPARYDEDTRFLMRDRRATVVFAADAIELANGQKREPMPGVQDTASQFIQFTWLFGSRPQALQAGATFDFPLALPRGLRRWTYDVVGSEALATPIGPLQAYHLKPRLGERRPGELVVEMWFAPELRYLPVKIRIEQDEATWLDLLIAKKPELAAQ